MKRFYPAFLLPLTVFLLAFNFRPSQGNDDLIQRITLQLHKLYTLFPQEKVYLHQDKSLYTLGETIWFKAYLKLPKSHPDSLSTVLYADLVSPDNKVLYTRKLKVKEGVVPGDFYLPDTLSEGLYQVRAYTNWMRNFDQQYFFSREIRIMSPSLQETKASVAFRTASHTGGDSVVAMMQLYRHPFEPVKQVKLRAQLVANGKTIQKFNLETNQAGKAQLSLNFAPSQASNLAEAFLVVQSDNKQDSFKKTFRLPVGKANLDLQFFPEGGYLVEGIASQVAFKAIDITGKGKEVKGAIYDQAGKLVQPFQSEHLGMGTLTLTPEPGKTYTARVQHADGTTETFDLPAAKKEGVVLHVNRRNEHVINFRLNNNYSSSSAAGPLYLVAHAEDSVIFAIRANTEKKLLESDIPVTRFPEGLVHFTLFDNTGSPLCERLVLVNNPRQLKLSIATDKAMYGKREKVKMLIEAKDEAGKPVAGNFSLAVRDALNMPETALQEENIYTSLSLSSNLKGYVEQPAYYFDKSQPKASKHLDLLLLTQGWRRFAWDDVLQDKFPSISYALEQNISFSGHVEKASGKKAQQKSGLTAIFRPNTAAGSEALAAFPHVVTAETGPDGNFSFVGLDFEDTLKVFLQARTPKGGSNQVIRRNIIHPPAPDFLPLQNELLDVTQHAAYRNRMNDWASAEKQYLISKGSILLKQVDVITGKSESNGRFRIHSKESVDAIINIPSDRPPFNNVLQYLDGRVAGVRVTGTGNNMQVTVRGLSSIEAGTTPLLLLDGMPIGIDQINMVHPIEIESIEILKGANAAIYGALSGNGVIAFYTRRGNANHNYAHEAAPGVISFQLPGYNRATEFYVPRYDVPNDRHNLPDFRSTLHWQHTITTDASGKAEITFYTSDVVTEFISICEGVSTGGLVGTATHRFSSHSVK